MPVKTSSPNYTQIPNIFFDHWMHMLTPGEFKILMVISRQTFGWHKERDRISLRQIAEKTGLSKQKIPKMLDSLIGHGLVTKIKSKDPFDGSDAPNVYEINVVEPEEGDGTLGTPPSHLRLPPPVTSGDSPPHPTHIDITKEKTTKERERPPNPLKGESVRFGKFVHLFQKEYEDLCAIKTKQVVDGLIEEINDHLSASGKKPYQDYAAVIRNWIRRRERESKVVSGRPHQPPKIDRSCKIPNPGFENQYDHLW